MTLRQVALHLQDALGEHGALIGGFCAALHGVDRFTRDVDFATDLESDQVLALLAGLELPTPARLVRGSEPHDLPWVVHGTLLDVPFQILPASAVGVELSRAETKADLRVADLRGFIVSKCLAGGQQDLHDVAVASLLHPETAEFARQVAAEHHCLDKLEPWLTDRRLLQRYGDGRR